MSTNKPDTVLINAGKDLSRITFLFAKSLLDFSEYSWLALDTMARMQSIKAFCWETMSVCLGLAGQIIFFSPWDNDVELYQDGRTQLSLSGLRAWNILHHFTFSLPNLKKCPRNWSITKISLMRSYIYQSWWVFSMTTLWSQYFVLRYFLQFLKLETLSIQRSQDWSCSTWPPEQRRKKCRLF